MRGTSDGDFDPFRRSGTDRVDLPPMLPDRLLLTLNDGSAFDRYE